MTDRTELAAQIQERFEEARATIKQAQDLARHLDADGFPLRVHLSKAVVEIGEAESELRSVLNPIMVSERVQREAMELLKPRSETLKPISKKTLRKGFKGRR